MMYDFIKSCSLVVVKRFIYIQMFLVYIYGKLLSDLSHHVIGKFNFLTESNKMSVFMNAKMLIKLEINPIIKK